MTQAVYCDRTANLLPLILAELPPGVVIYGGGHFLTALGNQLIKEQYPPYIGTMVPSISAISGPLRPMLDVAGEHLLVGRYGVATWGHWLGELLPKITLVEQAFPNRFSFVLPQQILDAGQSGPWPQLRQSLVACGIGMERVHPARTDSNYRFGKLFALTSVFSDHVIHPAASASLRSALDHIPAHHTKSLAIVREGRFGRSIANSSDVYADLAQAGFRSETSGAMPFTEQVSLFKGCETVFGVLGSDLTNLLFSPEGVRVISAAPDTFGDRFFYALVLDRSGSMIDIRGTVTQQNEVHHKSSFKLDRDYLKLAIGHFANPARVHAHHAGPEATGA